MEPWKILGTAFSILRTILITFALLFSATLRAIQATRLVVFLNWLP